MRGSAKSAQKIAMRVSWTSIGVNTCLFLFKLFAGLTARSSAMVSDAVHSASDVFSTIIVMIGVRISGKKSDREHQYGHERLECVASILLAMILFLTGLGIGIRGVEKILLGAAGAELASPGPLALAAAAISIGVKEWMYWYTRNAARKIHSGALLADAWHHRSDALSSVGAFAGILGARLGYPILDPAASFIICLFIAKAALDIFKDSVDKMVDKACDEATNERIRNVIQRQEGVIGIDVLRTRLFGAKMYVDIEILVDGTLTLKEAHHIAESVHISIEKEFENVKHCMVHVNPEL